jgi:hypothetical protein
MNCDDSSFRIQAYDLGVDGMAEPGLSVWIPGLSFVNLEALPSGFWVSSMDCLTAEVDIRFVANDGGIGPASVLGIGPLIPRMRPGGLGVLVRRPMDDLYEVTRMNDDGTASPSSTLAIRVPNGGLPDPDHEISLAGTALVPISVWPTEYSDQAILSFPRDAPPRVAVIARRTLTSFPPSLFWVNGALFAHDIESYAIHRIVCD